MTLAGNFNRRAKGKLKDKLITHALEDWGVMDSRMISVLFYSDIYWSLRKAQEKLCKMASRGHIQREMSDGTYLYYLEDLGGRTAHKLAINWFRLWLELKRLEGEKIHVFKYEDNYKILQADAFIAVKNTNFKTFKFYFLEMDLSHSNKFDKVKKYNELFKQQNILEGHWWFKLAERFPLVYVVTTTEKRKEAILELTNDRTINTEGVKFKVLLLDDIKREVIRR